MLTLDEPDAQMTRSHDAWSGALAGDVLPVAHLFLTVRQWCDHPPRALVSRDSDPLYRTHGDPRD